MLVDKSTREVGSSVHLIIIGAMIISRFWSMTLARLSISARTYQFNIREMASGAPGARLALQIRFCSKLLLARIGEMIFALRAPRTITIHLTVYTYALESSGTKISCRRARSRENAVFRIIHFARAIFSPFVGSLPFPLFLLSFPADPRPMDRRDPLHGTARKSRAATADARRRRSSSRRS